MQEGGYSEHSASRGIAVRERQRDGQDSTGRAQAELPDCPLCGKPMVLRTAQGKKRRRPVLGLRRLSGMQGQPIRRRPKKLDRSVRSDRSVR